MQNKVEKLLANTRYSSNEKEITRLQNQEDYNPSPIIALSKENLNLISSFKANQFDEFIDDDQLQVEWINTLGYYYLMLYKAYSALKNPTELDELERLNYKKLAAEYKPDEVKQVHEAWERNRIDEDYSLALVLNDVEEEELKKSSYPLNGFFRLKPNEDDSNEKNAYSSNFIAGNMT